MAANKVLIVDDHKIQRELYSLILEESGYEVATARDKVEALGLAREDNFDLVLVDDKTDGTDELTLIMELIEQDPTIIVLMIITGGEKIITRGPVESIKRLLQSPAFFCLEKPIDLNLLLKTIRAISMNT